MKKRTIAAATLVIAALAVGSVSAGVISIDFNNTTDPNWTVSGPETAGPLGSANWNSTSAASGTGQALIDDAGAATGATLTWNSANTWSSGDGNGTTDEQVAHVYLDDGTTTNIGGAVSSLITISGISYAEYRVYGLLSNGDGAEYSSRNFQVNGNYVWGAGVRDAQADVYGNTDAALAATGNRWVELEQGVTRGNYWTYETSGSTLVVNGIDKWAGGRGSIAGVVIEQIPEPATLGLVALFGGALVMMRRKMKR